MAEEINYASVVFKHRGPRPQAKNKDEIVYDDVRHNSETTGKHHKTNAKIKDEIVYDEVRTHSQTPERQFDSHAGPSTDTEPDKGRHYKQLVYCFGTGCIILLLGITGILCVLFSYITLLNKNQSLFKSEQMAAQAELDNLTSLYADRTSENKNLMMNIKDLTEQLRKLNQSTSVLEDENTNLKAEKENFTEKIQDLETEKKNLTGQIQHMETEWIKFNASRAQWSINAYCRQQKSPTTCKPCEKDWLYNQSSCCAVNNPDPAGQRSWEEARKDCRGKGSDLVVVADDNEKNYIRSISWGSSGLRGYWIGLRAEDGKWKWIDGSDLANIYWMTAPATDGQCVISVQRGGWKSVRCDEKQQWICEKAALSV